MSEYQKTWRKILRSHQTNQGSLAEIMGFSIGKINKILNEETSLTVEIFTELKDILSLDAKEVKSLGGFIKEPLDTVEKEKEAKKSLVAIAKYFDLAVLGKVLGMHTMKNSIEKLYAILKFLDVKDIEAFNDKIPNDIKETVGLARQFKLDVLEPSSANLFIFRKQCDMRLNELNNKKTPAYNRDKLLKLIEKAHTYTKDVDNGLLNFVAELKKCGVVVIEQAHLPKTYCNGLAYYNGKTPIIVLTYRLKKHDNVFFALFHEIGHIVLHLDYLKKHEIIMHESDLKSSIEEQAEDFARETLKVNQIVKEAILIRRNKGLPTAQDIEYISNKLDIGSGIVVGILQFARIIPYSKFNEFKTEAVHLHKEGYMP